MELPSVHIEVECEGCLNRATTVTWGKGRMSPPDEWASCGRSEKRNGAAAMWCDRCIETGHFNYVLRQRRERDEKARTAAYEEWERQQVGSGNPPSKEHAVATNRSAAPETSSHSEDVSRHSKANGSRTSNTANGPNLRTAPKGRDAKH